MEMKLVFKDAGKNTEQGRDQQNMAAVVEFTTEDGAIEVADTLRAMVRENPPTQNSKFQGTEVFRDGKTVICIVRVWDTARATADGRAWGFMGKAIGLVFPEDPVSKVRRTNLSTRAQAIDEAAAQA